MENTEQRKNLYFLFEFSSIEACFQVEAYLTPLKLVTGEKIVDKLKVIENEKEILVNFQSKNFFIWGFTDILRLFIFDDLKGFAELQKLKPACNVDDLKYCAGFSYIREGIELDEILKEYPLLGISFLKFKDDLFKHIKAKDYTYFIFESLKEQIEEAIKDEKENYCVFPIISYGWEDVILLFFSKSYDLMKKSILMLREIKAVDIEKSFLKTKKKRKFTHIFMNTFTIFGTYFPNCSLKGMNKSTNRLIRLMKKSMSRLKEIINKDDKAYISGIKFQIRPGHEKKLEEELSKKLLNVDIKPAPYRGDLCLHFKKLVNFHRFLDYYRLIIKIIEDKRTPVISLETEFVMDKKLLVGLQSTKVNKDIEEREIIKTADKKIIKWLKNEKILEEHSLLGFINLLSDASYFENHYFIKQTMSSWTNIIITLKNFLNSIKKNWSFYKKHPKYRKKLIDNFREDIDEFFILLPIAFTDRFRGTYPVGETSTMPLLTYATSLQKFLICIDYLAIKVFEDMFSLFKINGKYSKNFSFCSFFTTEYSPATQGFMWKTNFIFIPNVFTCPDIAYLFHEVGHAFLEMIDSVGKELISLKIITEDFDRRFYKDPYLRRHMIEEILADYFFLCLGLRGTIGELKKFYSKHRVKKESSIRRKGVSWLYNNIDSHRDLSSPLPNRDEFKYLNKALSHIINSKRSLIHFVLLKLKEHASSYNFCYDSLFMGENWIEYFLKFPRKD